MDIGARLRHAREARGLTIDAVSRSTRIQTRLLTAIEQNDSVSLPPRPYGRGFVRAYASEVGLDPEEVVREFFSQFAPSDSTPAPAQRPNLLEQDVRGATWAWPLGAMLGYAAIGALVIFAGQWAMQVGGEAGAVGTTGTALPEPTPTITRQPASEPAAAPAGVAVALEAQRSAWITAIVDGRRAVYRVLEPGERVSLNGTREVSVRTGDAGAVLWRVNGRDPVPMGTPGQVLTVRVTPESDARVKQDATNAR